MKPANEIKKVAIIGPECTGKSDLSAFLATQFNTVWVPEFARTYINSLDRPYLYDDLTTIALGQLALEDQMQAQAGDVLFCDTNLYVIKIWSQFRFGHVDPVIEKLIRERRYDLYFLTYVDIPWEEDPQREHPDKRELLYTIYLEEMKHQSVPFIEIKGSRSERQRRAVEAVEEILKKQSS